MGTNLVLPTVSSPSTVVFFVCVSSLFKVKMATSVFLNTLPFPDWWCSDLGTENPSYGDIDFWTEVFETHRTVTGTSTKPKTQAQIIKWLKNPYSDSAEYKMWGNGVAWPCVCFVLSGIVWVAQNCDK